MSATRRPEHPHHSMMTSTTEEREVGRDDDRAKADDATERSATPASRHEARQVAPGRKTDGRASSEHDSAGEGAQSSSLAGSPTDGNILEVADHQTRARASSVTHRQTTEQVKRESLRERRGPSQQPVRQLPETRGQESTSGLQVGPADDVCD